MLVYATATSCYLRGRSEAQHCELKKLKSSLLYYFRLFSFRVSIYQKCIINFCFQVWLLFITKTKISKGSKILNPKRFMDSGYLCYTCLIDNDVKTILELACLRGRSREDVGGEAGRRPGDGTESSVEASGRAQGVPDLYPSRVLPSHISQSLGHHPRLCHLRERSKPWCRHYCLGDVSLCVYIR